jgi:hypothetical protein
MQVQIVQICICISIEKRTNIQCSNFFGSRDNKISRIRQKDWTREMFLICFNFTCKGFPSSYSYCLMKVQQNEWLLLDMSKVRELDMAKEKMEKFHRVSQRKTAKTCCIIMQGSRYDSWSFPETRLTASYDKKFNFRFQSSSSLVVRLVPVQRNFSEFWACQFNGRAHGRD